MMKYILAVQCVVGILILIVILLQRNNSNILDSLGASNINNNQQSLEPNLLYNIMVFLSAVFFICALILANLSNRYNEKVEQNFIMDNLDKSIIKIKEVKDKEKTDDKEETADKEKTDVKEKIEVKDKEETTDEK